MNRLARETSPYLLQHRDNPVHWWPWGEDAFAAARKEQKPVLLSVGYAACHWCHVMAHESFEDPGIANVMNERFINIKVDREERPDIDHVYMSALHLLGQQGGWPLTMFLTPGGEPFAGGTYFPPSGRYGRPGFPEVLKTVSDTYRSERDRVQEHTRAIREALANLAAGHPGAIPGSSELDAAARGLAGLLDPERGGIQGAPKFPNLPMLDLAWRRGQGRNAVLTSLRSMSRGGIYDHLGGGLARYSVDDRWLVPHFEKMLYDTAQYVRMLARVWRTTREPLLAVRVRESVEWMLRDMRLPGGAFASSLDADSEGVEGRYYVWEADELDEVLGEDSPAFCHAYGASESGNWEGKNILNRLHQEEFSVEEDLRLLPLRERLLARRETRVRPAFDDKVLADWNGLAIAALAEAGITFGEDRWVDAAEQALAFVGSEMAAGPRLFHSWREGRAQVPGMLDDYAFMADAALVLADAGRETAGRAEAWMEVLEESFATGDGGYWRSPGDGEKLIARSRVTADDATPSGAGVAADVLARLWYRTGESRWRERCEELVKSSSEVALRNPAAFPSLLSAMDTLQESVEILISCPEGASSGARKLLEVAWAAPPVARTIRILTEGEALPDGVEPSGEAAQAYVCRGGTCSLPVSETGPLEDLLAAPGVESGPVVL